jgi:hypothetical protein
MGGDSMSVQRWGITGLGHDNWQVMSHPEGEWVRYDDTLPRVLTADDPEPAVGSVVLDRDGTAGQRVYTDDGVTTIWRFCDDDEYYEWRTVTRVRSGLRLLHDGGAA